MYFCQVVSIIYAHPAMKKLPTFSVFAPDFIQSLKMCYEFWKPFHHIQAGEANWGDNSIIAFDNNIQRPLVVLEGYNIWYPTSGGWNSRCGSFLFALKMQWGTSW